MIPDFPLPKFRWLTTTLILWLSLSLMTPLAMAQGTAQVDEDPVPAEPELRWWKGNLHTHSLWSDGDDFPEMIAEWYRTHDYNFLALSDHNVLSQGERWMSAKSITERGGKDVIDKYTRRFGGGWVETRPIENDRGGGENDAEQEVRLKPLDEFRYLVESRGSFIMIPGEEISDRAEGRPVHMNATNLLRAIGPLGGETVRESLQNNLRAVEEQASREGREIMLHLNHPNFGWAFTAGDIAAVTAERFFEVYNGHPAVNHNGDDEHPGVERIWDVANAIRLSVLNAEPLLGIATDDSHHYHAGGDSRNGRGWVMVRSGYLSPEHLIRAMRAGEFYASSGVELDRMEFDPAKRTLDVAVVPSGDENYTIEFIGSVRQSDPARLPPEDQIGIVLATATGTSASYQMGETDLYIRALVTSSAGADDPSFDGQKKQAWTQPVGWLVRDSK